MSGSAEALVAENCLFRDCVNEGLTAGVYPSRETPAVKL